MRVQGVACFEIVYKGARELNGVQKCSVCCRRESDVFIVSLQQTVHSALLRGFEPCSATGSMCIKAYFWQDCRIKHGNDVGLPRKEVLLFLSICGIIRFTHKQGIFKNDFKGT